MRIFTLSLLALACSSSPPIATGPGAGMSGSLPRVPTLHRAKSEECVVPRPAGQASGIPGGRCTSDSDCTQGVNGRCGSILTAPPSCTYDECASDKMCNGAQVCECRSKVESMRNLCHNGNCRIDADCLGNFCSPSALEVFANCRSTIESGSFGFFCHTKSDECIDDSDCSNEPNKACVFSVKSLHWACAELRCTK
jgi:hypothetical protein